MLPTYTDSVAASFIDNYLAYQLAAILINAPSLGLTDVPSESEMTARRTLTMVDVAGYELTNDSYRRMFIQLAAAAPLEGLLVSSATTTFVGPTNAAIGPATHIVYARGVLQSGANNSNGNNRGSTQGQVILVEPLSGAPLSLSYPYTLTHTVTFRAGSRTAF